jgi:hypothetical protein
MDKPDAGLIPDVNRGRQFTVGLVRPQGGVRSPPGQTKGVCATIEIYGQNDLRRTCMESGDGQFGGTCTRRLITLAPPVNPCKLNPNPGEGVFSGGRSLAGIVAGVLAGGDR